MKTRKIGTFRTARQSDFRFFEIAPHCRVVRLLVSNDAYFPDKKPNAKPGMILDPRRSATKNDFYLSFPYTIIGVGEASVFMAFSNTPIQTIDDSLYYPMLPNVCISGDVCLNGFISNDEKEVFDKIWQTGWIIDSTGWAINQYYESIKKTEPSEPERFNLSIVEAAKKMKFSYKKWENESLANPNYGLTVNWPSLSSFLESNWKQGCTITSIVQSLIFQ